MYPLERINGNIWSFQDIQPIASTIFMDPSLLFQRLLSVSLPSADFVCSFTNFSVSSCEAGDVLKGPYLEDVQVPRG